MKSSELKKFELRLWAIGVAFFLIFSGLLYRAFSLQVSEREYFRRMIRQSRESLFSISPKRGIIFDRSLNPLALSAPVKSLGLNPRAFRNNWRPEQRKKLISRLSEILGISPVRLEFLTEQDLFFVWLKRHISESELRAVKKLKIGRALYIEEESKRYYPNFTLAANLIGHTDIDGRGIAGVELYFDKLLRGKRQEIRFLRDSKGRMVTPPLDIDLNSAQGMGVVLSIDSTIQFIAESELEETVKKFRAKRGVAIVMAPQTGDILALAVYPTFDPNNYKRYPPSHRNNWAVSAPYEPGSTLKVITMATALELNAVKLSERIDCEGGRMRVGRYIIRDDHPSKHPLTPEEIIQHSSNICTAKIAFRIGKGKLYSYLRKFGFGQKTGIGLPGESKGILYPPRRWAKISLANIAFGQGIAVTPIQLITAINAIANGGVLMKPRLYLKLLDRNNRVYRKFSPQPIRRVITEKTAFKIAEIMESVVEKGTGRKAAIPGVRVAGKTGTSQKPRKNGRGYGRERIASFVGFLPAERPKLTILVVVDEPQGLKYGGSVAAPAWKKIAVGALQYLGVLQRGTVARSRKKKFGKLAKSKGGQTPSALRKTNQNLKSGNLKKR